MEIYKKRRTKEGGGGGMKLDRIGSEGTYQIRKGCDGTGARLRTKLNRGKRNFLKERWRILKKQVGGKKGKTITEIQIKRGQLEGL